MATIYQSDYPSYDRLDEFYSDQTKNLVDILQAMMAVCIFD